MTGIETSNNNTRAALQSAVTSALTAGTMAEWETGTPGSGIQGYSNTAYPNSAGTVPLTVNYYDDYTFQGQPAAFAAPSGSSVMTKGLLTATKTAVLNTSYNTTPDMLWTAHYYDDFGRATQSYSQHYLGGVLSPYNYDLVSSSYDFTNEVTAATRQHFTANAGNNAAILKVTIANTYVYDHTGKKKQTLESINNGTNVVLSQNDYNEVGQAVTKHLHSTNNESTFMQDIAFAYNERGWLLSNSAALFTEQLQYNSNPLNVTSFAPQWNGNIASQTRMSANIANTTYAYAYDYLNRLTGAVSTDNYNETGIGYDLAGNIKALQRTWNGITPIDNLSYTYTDNSGNYTNQVQGITDASPDVSGKGYPTGTFSYQYDGNGNMKQDNSKALTIGTYNMLNLPQNLTLNSAAITYTYDATGRKLRKVSTAGGGSNTDYIDGIEYDAGVLNFIQTEEGRALYNNGNINYEYNLNDHLGNVRLTFDTHTTTPTIVQQDDYYSFGYEISRGTTTFPKNEYLYNKKELQEDLGQYDYGARFYDPVIARWTSIDPHAQKYQAVSPYNYVDDNPIKFVDEDGKDVVVPDKTQRAQILGYINSQTTAKFAFNSKGHLYIKSENGGGKKGKSEYYTNRLKAAIADHTDVIDINVSSTYKDFHGNTHDVQKEGGGGYTSNQIEGGETGIKKISDVTISGKESVPVVDVNGQKMTESPGEILLHELVGHAIPFLVGKDTGDAVKDENKARKEQGKKERKLEKGHYEEMH